MSATDTIVPVVKGSVHSVTGLCRRSTTSVATSSIVRPQAKA